VVGVGNVRVLLPHADANLQLVLPLQVDVKAGAIVNGLPLQGGANVNVLPPHEDTYVNVNFHKKTERYKKLGKLIKRDIFS
jgi:hypothetical protein